MERVYGASGAGVIVLWTPAPLERTGCRFAAPVCSLKTHLRQIGVLPSLRVPMLDFRERIGGIFHCGSAASFGEQCRGAVLFHTELATGGRTLGPFTVPGGRPSCKRPTWLRGPLVPASAKSHRAWLRAVAVLALPPYTQPHLWWLIP